MEVVGAVSAAVPVAMLLTDKVMAYLSEKEESGAKENVDRLKSWLSEFQAFLKEKEKQEKNLVSKDLVDRIRRLTADIEDALDDFMFDVPFDHSHTTRLGQTLHELGHSIKYIRPLRQLSSRKKRIAKIIKSENLIDRLRREATGLELPDLRSEQFLQEDTIVGFTTRRIELLNQLTNDDSKRTTIQVVGPGGSGKTFLVKNVYQDEKVERHFPCRAWIQVSRCSPHPHELLMGILRQFDPTSDMGQIIDAAAIIDTGQKLLNGRRYLIVLDNVWSRQGYTLIANHLPNQGTGSRIIITSRNSNLADQPDYTHKLDGLINEEAEELFLRRLFPKRQSSSSRWPRSCSSDECLPENLRGVSKKILDKCDRLPLAVAAIGSLLSNKPRSEFVWKKFHDSLASEIASGSELHIIGSILRPSFMDLPDNLKSCFLYFSIFPEDQPISRGRLTRSWQAEGFVEEKKGKTPEEVAETYLDELIRRSLVRVCATEIDDRVRTCHVLRFYHEFIVPLSVNGNFVTVVDHKSKSVSRREKVRRLSFHEEFPTKLSEISDSEHVRTLFVFGHMDELTKDMISLPSRYIRKITGSSTAVSQDLHQVFDKFRLLKVLDLQEVPLQKLPENIGSFVLLKCLNLRRTRIETVPDSIAKLYLLETLDLKYTLVKELPKWIHKLQKLRHLLVSCGEAQGAKVSSAIGSLSSLQKMSLIVVDKYEDIVKLGNLVQLRKLGLADLQNHFGTKLCESIQEMENLSKFDVRAKTGEFLSLERMQTPPKNIQRLHLKGCLQRLPSWISLLSSLVKVVLKCSKLGSHQNPLEMLEGLSSLMELEMVDYYIGRKLVFKARSFKNLRKLHVEQFDELIEVVVEDMALPMLKRLTICKCKKLKPLTPRHSLGQLEELELYEMSDAFLSDIQRRIHQGELVDHIQEPVPSSSSTTERGISTEIRSYRHIS